MDAKKYKNKTDYKKESKGYRATLRNKWLDIVYTQCGFGLTKPKLFGFWTKEKCLLESEKYEKFKDFNKNRNLTTLCKRHNWMNDIIKHRNW